MADCVEAVALIHEELREIAKSAASFVEKHGFNDRSEYGIRSAITQTILNTGRVPPSLMAELIRHTLEELAGRDNLSAEGKGHFHEG